VKRVVVLCGGRGGSTILSQLNSYPDVQLTAIINGFDDGLSTGFVRRVWPTMLGPSDFRKVSHTLGTNSAVIQALEIRAKFENPDQILYRYLPNEMRADLFRAFSDLLAYCRLHGESVPSLVFGNLVFASLCYKRAFQQAVDAYAKLCGVTARLVSVTDEAAVLIGRTLNGGILGSEAAITQAVSEIEDVTIWPLDTRPSRLAEASVYGADIIIYAPGTYHSSLRPSLQLLGQALTRTLASRVLVANATRDTGMGGWSWANQVQDMRRAAGGDVVDLVLCDEHSNLLGVPPAGLDSEPPLKTGAFVVWNGQPRHSGLAIVEALREAEVIK
jgi:2-phospho-L-lactate transferase/gluconeogenesis factor (CofD/UPF0052 family)